MRKIAEDNTVDGVIKQKLLIIVATDGGSNDGRGTDSKKRLYDWLVKTRNLNRTYVEFLICTDEDSVIDYLNSWDKKIPKFDVTDDYHTEKAQTLKARGETFPFSRGDYIVKCLLGSIDPKIDGLDEKSCCILS